MQHRGELGRMRLRWSVRLVEMEGFKLGECIHANGLLTLIVIPEQGQQAQVYKRKLT